MNQDREEQIKACVRELAKLLYEEADKSQLTDLESIEKKVRTSNTRTCESRNSPFFVEQKTGTKVGKTRKIKSLVGDLTLKAKQLQRLGLKPRIRLSPLLKKCCLRL